MGNNPRDALQQPFEGYPAYGAVHDVRPNEQLRGFMFDFARIADGVFAFDTPVQVVDSMELLSPDQRSETISIINENRETLTLHAPEYDSRKYYRIFDPETLGVSVVEMDGSKRAAQAARVIWQKNDLGAVEKEAKNVMGRELPNVTPRLFFKSVMGAGGRLPNAPRSEVRQKLALLPDTTQERFPETMDLMQREADIIIDAIRNRMKQFVYPWDFLPHLTYAVFRTEARSEQIIEVEKGANQYLENHPFGVQLDALSFRHKLRRSGSAKRPDTRKNS